MADDHNMDIAIIGMAGRFPGATNVDQYWSNLRDGIESITFFSDKELENFGISPNLIADPAYVKAAAMLDGFEMFDAAFFGFTPKEAAIMDPQHRVFLECAWAALESAGYPVGALNISTGVYGGATINTYLLCNLASNPDILDSLDLTQINIANGGDFLTTRVSYKLNLKGPSHLVQSACSTSLVAVHVACQNLLDEVCDMALAGGVSINMKMRHGYRYLEGGMASPDGHCRAFDAQAQGTVFGSGAGIVVLKRLEDALAQGDYIHAVIKGSAVNNDGSLKVGYTAPSVEGQAEVITEALACAGVEAETISYVEAHGTGTPLGDPVEIEALTKAFGATTSKKGYCGLGSVKSNIGHLDAAAGVAGLIKTVLALKHRQMPPTLHYRQANPNIAFAQTPFYVNAELREWERVSGVRRAGVSSFGVGGTNAHLILEEAPEREAIGEARRAWQVLAVSAKSAAGLEEARANLAGYLKQEGSEELGEVAYTLQVGRSGFEHRRVVVCRERGEAVRGLEGEEGGLGWTSYREVANRPVVFLFPGQGAQYVNMGRGLYESEAVYRRQIDRCAEAGEAEVGADLRAILYPKAGQEEWARQQLDETRVTQPALYMVEWGLAKLWESYGVEAEAMLGHSLGEYVAASLAGVMEVEEGMRLVAARGRLMQKVEGGAMVVAAMSEKQGRGYEREGVWVGAVNGARQVVMTGRREAMEEVEEELREAGIASKRLRGKQAFHSGLMEEVAEEYEQEVRKVRLREPKKKYLSSLTGRWVRGEEAVEAKYWVRQMVEGVRYWEGVKELMSEGSRVYVEVGPGEGLLRLVRNEGREVGEKVEGVRSLSEVEEGGERDEEVMARSLGRMWGVGVEVEWERYHGEEKRVRVPLPTYPFQRQRFWIEAHPAADHGPAEPPTGKLKSLSDWFYVPTWKRGRRPVAKAGRADQPENRRGWMIFADEAGLGEAIIEQLGKRQGGGERVVRVRRAGRYRRVGEGDYEIAADQGGDYERLIREVVEEGGMVGRVVHLWGVGKLAGTSAEARFRQAQEQGYESVVKLGRGIKQEGGGEEVEVVVVSEGMQEVESGDKGEAAKATVLGALKVMGQEMEEVRWRSVDVEAESWRKRGAEVGEQIVREAEGGSEEEEVAYRGKVRWVKSYERERLEEEQEGIRELRRNGVFLITDGLNGIAYALAEHLASSLQARLCIIDDSLFPPRSHWAQWLVNHDGRDLISRKMKKVEALEKLGAEVLILKASVSDSAAMKSAVDQIQAHFGEINGVIYGSEGFDLDVFRPIEETTCEQSEALFASKAFGLFVLDEVLQTVPLDFCLLISSLSSVLGGPGYTAWAAANSFLDSYSNSSGRKNASDWLSVNCDSWGLNNERKLAFGKDSDEYAMTTAEGIEVFRRIISQARPGQVIVSTGDLSQRVLQWIRREGSQVVSPRRRDEVSTLHPRPALSNPYAPPSTDLERAITEIWQQALGIEPIGLYDNFFDLGGDSLIAIQVIAELKKGLNTSLPVVSLYEGLTVKSLAELLKPPPEIEAEAAAQSDEREGRMLRRKQFQQKERSRKQQAKN